MDTSKAVTHVSLCAGYGGIDLGLKRAIPSLRTVAFSEIEAFACANLVSKMESGHLDPAPIWTDLKTFPYSEFRDRVDILSGGYPCQPFSAAGKRLGKDDPRHLWPYIADGIAVMRPRLCFFENVEGHISLGLSDVIEDLAGMGYRTTWGIFSASEVGAPHQRKRVFILAHCQRTGLEGFGVQPGNEDDAESWDSGSPEWPSRPGEQQHGWEPPRVISGLEDATSQRSRCEGGDALHQGWAASEAGTESVPQDTGWKDGATIANNQPTGGDGAELGDTSCEQDRGLQQPGVQSDAGSAGEELGDAGCERQEKRQVEADGSEQSDEVRDMADSSFLGSNGRPDGSCWRSRESGEAGVDAAGCGSQGDGLRQTQPPLGGDLDGASGGLDYARLCVSCDNRTDELRLLGNGVVPATAHKAFVTLLQELT